MPEKLHFFNTLKSLLVELLVNVLAVRYEFHVLLGVDLAREAVALGCLLLG